MSLHNIEIDLEYRPKISSDTHVYLADYNGPLSDKNQILSEAKAIDAVFSVWTVLYQSSSNLYKKL